MQDSKPSGQDPAMSTPNILEPNARTLELRARLVRFMDEHVYPNEHAYFAEAIERGPAHVPPILEQLKAKARAEGLWNLFLPEADHGAGLTNLEYATLCEVMGRSHLAPEVFNCSAPDTGNMEVLARYGTDEHKAQWLEPLLRGEIRSAFAMTEPDGCGSDPNLTYTRADRLGNTFSTRHDGHA